MVGKWTVRRWSGTRLDSLAWYNSLTQTMRAKSWNERISPLTTCHVSCVMCHVSCVRCQVSHVMCHAWHFFFFFFRQSGGASRWRVCYQRGLPRLVLQYTLVAIPNCTPLLHKIMVIVKTSGDCRQSNFPLSRTNLVLIVGEAWYW